MWCWNSHPYTPDFFHLFWLVSARAWCGTDSLPCCGYSPHCSRARSLAVQAYNCCRNQYIPFALLFLLLFFTLVCFGSSCHILKCILATWSVTTLFSFIGAEWKQLCSGIDCMEHTSYLYSFISKVLSICKCAWQSGEALHPLLSSSVLPSQVHFSATIQGHVAFAFSICFFPSHFSPSVTLKKKKSHDNVNATHIKCMCEHIV